VRDHVGVRVRIYGWVHSLRMQGSLVFIDLRDGTGVPAILQCVLAGKLAQTYDALTLHREAAVCITGTLKKEEVSIAQPAGTRLCVVRCCTY
jgi:asparaginyl-tRNA synthetase